MMGKSKVKREKRKDDLGPNHQEPTDHLPLGGDKQSHGHKQKTHVLHWIWASRRMERRQLVLSSPQGRRRSGARERQEKEGYKEGVPFGKK
jgi:hypothetical protein